MVAFSPLLCLDIGKMSLQNLSVDSLQNSSLESNWICLILIYSNVSEVLTVDFGLSGSFRVLYSFVEKRMLSNKQKLEIFLCESLSTKRISICKRRQFSGKSLNFWSLLNPCVPERKQLFVHKIARSLLIAGLGYRVQNWKFEVFNQGKWKLPPFQG